MNRFPFLVSVLASACTLLGLVSGCCCHNCCVCSEQEDGVEVARADVPAAVMATIEREAAGGTIGEIEKEVEDGRVVYAAEAMVNGEEWEIEVGEDGKLLSREKAEDEEEDNDD